MEQKSIKNLPPALWQQLRATVSVPRGAETLRPLLKIVAEEIFNELSGLKKATNTHHKEG